MRMRGETKKLWKIKRRNKDSAKRREEREQRLRRERG